MMPRKHYHLDTAGHLTSERAAATAAHTKPGQAGARLNPSVKKALEHNPSPSIEDIGNC